MRNAVLLLMVSLQLVCGYGGYGATPTPDYYSGAVAGGQEARAASLPAYGQEPVQDTPEVARAKQEHLAAVARAKALIGVGGAPLQPVQDTPEVAAARARHLAIVQGAHAQARVDVHPQQTVSWSTPAPGVLVTGSPSAYSTVASIHQQWGVSSTPAPVHDTVEVAAAKAKHLAAVEEAKARLATASSYSHPAAAQTHQYSGAYSSGSSYSHQTGYAVTPSPVQDTAEVAAAKEQHLAAVSQAAARVSSSQSIAAQYAAPRNPAFHYPNVPGELPRFPAPAPALSRVAAPAWQAAGVRYNIVSEEGGQYVPDDEGRYYSNQNDEGQYDARLDAEGQYDPRLNDEGQYIPSLNDEGQWVPSANEGQYIHNDQGDQGEDNMPYSYSYSDGLSSKTETKTADGITRGRFSYVDANGVLQAVEYQADNVHGFRASGTNLPQPPVAAPAAPAAPARIYQPPAAAYPAVSSYAVPAYRAPVAAYGVPAPPRPIAAAYGTPLAAPSIALAAPDVPADTPEVAAAKAAHFAAHREAGARLASAYGR